MKLFSQGRFRQNGLHVSDIAKIYDAGLFYIRHNFENGAFHVAVDDFVANAENGHIEIHNGAAGTNAEHIENQNENAQGERLANQRDV